MSLDRSLKTKAALTRHRNVLSRAERIKVLTDEERWPDGRSVYGLPKVSHRKATVGKKEKKAKEGDAAAAGTAAAPGAAAPAAAPAAAAPAAKKGAEKKPDAKKK